MKRFLLHAFFWVALPGVLLAQHNGSKGAEIISGHSAMSVRGNTYALIIGISEYADPLMPSLKYADDDAMAFKNFLMSKAGGDIKDTNIRIFLNKDATAMNISQKGIRWLMNKAKNEGDRVYIYFSGHGDATSESEMFLLAHDVIADSYSYSVHGALQIFNLKRRILELTARKVEVVLITDACRTNELQKGVNVPIYYTKRIMEENVGEIQFMSCSANESSYEDKRWGNGRGVFSYHLIEGLMGLADENNDLQVTVYELYKYVNEQVRKDRTDPVTKRPLQRPAFCCSENEYDVLAIVDSDTKEQLLASKSNQREISGNTLAMGKGISLITYSNDTILLRLYNQFRSAINSNNLIKPEKDNALYYYRQIESMPEAQPYLDDLKIDLIASLSVRGQQAIEVYLKGADSLFPASYFSEASANFRYALSLIDKTDEYYPIFLSRQLFLEAKSYAGENKYREQAFNLMMRALQMDTSQAYIHKGLGDLYYSFRTYDKAMIYYQNTIRLAPRWHVAYDDLAGLYLDRGQYDLAIKYYRMSFSLGNNLSSLHNIGVSFSYKNENDSAMYYYNKVLSTDSSYIYSWLGLYYMHKQNADEEKMIKCLLKAYYSDTTHFRTLMYLGDYYFQQENYKDAYEWFDYCSNFYPSSAEVAMWKGYMKEMMKDYSKAISFYQSAIHLDNYYTPAYKQMGILFNELNRYDKAIPYLNKPLQFDTEYNPSILAFAYYKLNYIDSAIAMLDISLQRNPHDGYALNLYGYIYSERNDWENALRMYKTALAVNPQHADYISNSALCYYELGIIDSSATLYQYLQRLYPQMIDGYKGLWNINYYLLKNFEEASHVMKIALDQGVDAYECIPYIIYSKLAMHDYQGAIESANELSWRYPNNLYLHLFYRSVIDATQKDEQSFCQHLQKALESGLSCEYLRPGRISALDEMLKRKSAIKIQKAYCR
ncbi:MAG: caspase family protein [Candidatus Competibacteraceae bacterium]|nr:caspase family protein [Candidatus Competibacteraceae bacterium]